MTAYYNEFDPFAAQWLRNLIDAGHIAPGDVDERSIVDVTADDVRGYTQAHFFAGIGGWSLALRLAGWPDDRPVWSGSCPCQPFSSAGKGAGFDDPRHLWPAWFRLIKECRPPACFGEQVSSPAGVLWFDALRDDMDSCGYAVAAVDLPACSVGAPHIRQRLWWVGYAASERRHGGVEDGHRLAAEVPWAGSQDDDGLAHSDDGGRCWSPQRILEPEAGEQAQRGDHADRRGLVNPWADLAWVECSDGRARPVPADQPALLGVAPGLPDGVVRPCPDRFPLAPPSPGRTGRLRGYGNAIVPQVAAAFIQAAMP